MRKKQQFRKYEEDFNHDQKSSPTKNSKESDDNFVEKTATTVWCKGIDISDLLKENFNVGTVVEF